MHRLISRALAFFRRKADSEIERSQHQRLLEDDTRLKTVHGVVTKFCTDYGWIDESIYYFNTDVTESVPLDVVEEDKTSHGLKVFKMDAFSDNCHGDGPPDSRKKISFGCITSLMGGTDYIHHTIYFSLDVVCKDFEPYQGDRVEVEFAIHPDTKSKKALSVKPLRHKHVHEVCISSVHGRHGVVDDTIFFTLDSLKLPAGYVPRPNDIVDVVIVESVQSCYIWRAVSMTPVHIL